MTIVVSSGVTSSGVAVFAGDEMLVSGGGTVSASVIDGIEVIDSAGLAVSDIVHSGGVQNLQGVSSETLVRLGGSQTVSAGGVASGTAVEGGLQVVIGSAVATLLERTVSVGHTSVEDVSGIASGTIVYAGAQERVYAGGEADGGVIYAHGLLDVVGGLASAQVFKNLAEAEVTGGVLSAALALSGSILGIDNGGTALATIVKSVGEMVVVGGDATSSYVRSGGSISALSGGVDSRTRVSAGGAENVLSGGTSIDSFVLSGGLETVARGTVSALTVSSGGELLWFKSPSTVISDLSVRDGGDIVLSFVSATETIADGVLDIYKSGTLVESATLAGNTAGLSFTSARGASNTTILTAHSGGAAMAHLNEGSRNQASVAAVRMVSAMALFDSAPVHKEPEVRLVDYQTPFVLGVVAMRDR